MLSPLAEQNHSLGVADQSQIKQSLAPIFGLRVARNETERNRLLIGFPTGQCRPDLLKSAALGQLHLAGNQFLWISLNMGGYHLSSLKSDHTHSWLACKRADSTACKKTWTHYTKTTQIYHDTVSVSCIMYHVVSSFQGLVNGSTGLGHFRKILTRET